VCVRVVSVIVDCDICCLSVFERYQFICGSVFQLLLVRENLCYFCVQRKG